MSASAAVCIKSFSSLSLRLSGSLIVLPLLERRVAVVDCDEFASPPVPSPPIGVARRMRVWLWFKSSTVVLHCFPHRFL